MTTEEIIEGNKLIAEFTGFKFNAYPKLTHYNITKPGDNIWTYANYELEGFNTHVLEYLKYHTSWDLIMHVVEKISRLHSDGLVKRAEMGEADKVFSLYLMANKERVWLAVIEFIKWYNKKK